MRILFDFGGCVRRRLREADEVFVVHVDVRHLVFEQQTDILLQLLLALAHLGTFNRSIIIILDGSDLR